MKRVLYIFLLACPLIQGQIANYVLNPGFEDVQTLPWHPFGHWVTGWSAIDTTKGAFLLRTVGPPFYNAPGGPGVYQYPRTGQNQIGYTFFCQDISCPDSARGYPRNRLRKRLNNGKVYCGRYYVNTRNASPLGIADFAMFAADSSLDTIKYCKIPLPYLSPQISHTGSPIVDTLNWVAVSGTFVAQGTEKYLVLGNFKPNYSTQTVVIQSSSVGANFTDAYFDDVSLVDMELPAFAGSNTSIWFGDSAFIGREPDVGIDYACQWFQLPNDTVPIDTIAGLWVKPTAPTTYVVRQQLWCSGVKWDTVTIQFLTVGLDDEISQTFDLYPNPSQGELVILSRSVSTPFLVTITDATGKLLLEHKVNAQSSPVRLNLPWPDGLYFVKVSTLQGTLTRKVVLHR